MSHIIGVDIGTSGIKVGAIDKNAQLTFLHKKSYDLLYPKLGWVEIDPESVWVIIEHVIEYTIKKVSEIGGEVDAISLSTFCNSSILFDRQGESLENGIMYLDTRSSEQAWNINEKIGSEKLFDITRNRVEPGMYTVTSLLWSKKHIPKKFNTAHKWGNLSTYILYKLTGRFVMDWTQASYTGLYDVMNYKWSEEIRKELDIPKDILPQVVSPFELVGYYNGITVVAGAADTACSSLALGIQPDDIFESVGTSDVLTVCTSNPNNLDTRFLNRCYVWENQWLSHGAMSTPGASIQWFYENFLNSDDDKHVLEELPLSSNVGSNGLFFLPYMWGERSPIWDSNARGAFIGLSLKTTKADMLKAIFEGTGYGLRQILEIIEENYALKSQTIQSIGGGSKNVTWAQTKANILDKEIEIKEVSETSILGTCLIAGQTMGYFSDLENRKNYIENPTKLTVKPEASKVRLYHDLYKKFALLYPSLKDFFRE